MLFLHFQWAVQGHLLIARCDSSFSAGATEKNFCRTRKIFLSHQRKKSRFYRQLSVLPALVFVLSLRIHRKPAFLYSLLLLEYFEYAP